MADAWQDDSINDLLDPPAVPSRSGEMTDQKRYEILQSSADQLISEYSSLWTWVRNTLEAENLLSKYSQDLEDALKKQETIVDSIEMINDREVSTASPVQHHPVDLLLIVTSDNYLDEAIEKIQQLISANIPNICVTRMRKTDAKTLIMEFETPQDRAEMYKCFRNATLRLSGKVAIKIPRKYNPTIKLHEIRNLRERDIGDLIEFVTGRYPLKTNLAGGTRRVMFIELKKAQYYTLLKRSPHSLVYSADHKIPYVTHIAVPKCKKCCMLGHLKERCQSNGDEVAVGREADFQKKCSTCAIAKFKHLNAAEVHNLAANKAISFSMVDHYTYSGTCERFQVLREKFGKRYDF